MPAYPYAAVLTNPGAETGNNTGWTVAAGSLTNVTGTANGPPHSGTRCWRAGASGVGAAYQAYAVDPSLYADIDAGLLKAIGRGWHETWTGDGDSGSLYMECWDAANTGFLGGMDVRAPNGTEDAWAQQTVEANVPAGTRIVRIGHRNLRASGSNLDSYWDDFELEFDLADEPHTRRGSQRNFVPAEWTNVVAVVSSTADSWGITGSNWSGPVQVSGFECYKDHAADAADYAAIDAGNLGLDFAAYHTANGNGIEPIKLVIQFLDVSSSVLGSIESSALPVLTYQTGTIKRAVGEIPAGTRTYRVHIVGGARSGANFDAYVSSFHWSVYSTAPDEVIIDAVKGSLEFAGWAGTVTYGALIEATTGEAILTGYGALVGNLTKVYQPETSPLHFTGYAAEIIAGQTIEAVTGSLVFTGFRGALVPYVSIDQAAMLVMGEVTPETRIASAPMLALVEIIPPARVSSAAVLALGEVIPPTKISSALMLVLADAEPCAVARQQLWRITRRDGVVLTFTSHDEDFVWVDGRTYKACNSLNPSASESASTLGSVGNIELEGIISHDDISEEDLYGGLYDDAFVEVWLVSWNDPTDTVRRLAAGWTGELDQGEGNFKLEVVGPGARLDQQALVQPYTPGCRRIFGSPQGQLPPGGCGVDIEARKAQGVVSSAMTRGGFTADVDEPSQESQWTNGKVTWTSGRNDGLTQEVKTVDFASGAIVLWVPTAYLPEYGDTFDLFPGCDKAKEGGCTLYDNIINFGGFPDVPGPDALMETPDAKV